MGFYFSWNLGTKDEKENEMDSILTPLTLTKQL